MLERFRPGKELAGVRVVSLIGEGRLGPLFKGEQITIGRLVALKVLNVPDAQWTQRYLQAVYVSGQLVHSNIALIFDIGQEENLSYVVREYVDGLSAQERLAGREPVPMAEAYGIISQVVYALEHAAERRVFHGALSPRKILLGPRGSVKVSGFGLPLTPPPRPGAASYNWHALPYTAPERVRGDGVAELRRRRILGGGGALSPAHRPSALQRQLARDDGAAHPERAAEAAEGFRPGHPRRRAEDH